MAEKKRPDCAACVHRNMSCTEDCPLAPHFPPSRTPQFQLVQKEFGLTHVKKKLTGLNLSQQQQVLQSLIWEATAWKENPVQGPFGHYRNLEAELDSLRAQQIRWNNQQRMMNMQPTRVMDERESRELYTGGSGSRNVHGTSHGFDQGGVWNNPSSVRNDEREEEGGVRDQEVERESHDDGADHHIPYEFHHFMPPGGDLVKNTIPAGSGLDDDQVVVDHRSVQQQERESNMFEREDGDDHDQEVERESRQGLHGGGVVVTFNELEVSIMHGVNPSFVQEQRRRRRRINGRDVVNPSAILPRGEIVISITVGERGQEYWVDNNVQGIRGFVDGVNPSFVGRDGVQGAILPRGERVVSVEGETVLRLGGDGGYPSGSQRLERESRRESTLGDPSQHESSSKSSTQSNNINPDN